MSLLIGFDFGGFPVLASDSLHVWTRPNGSNEVNDAVEKIRRTPRAMAAGIGSINVFEPVLKDITANGFDKPSEVTQKLRTSFAAFVSRPGARTGMRGNTAIMAT